MNSIGVLRKLKDTMTKDQLTFIVASPFYLCSTWLPAAYNLQGADAPMTFLMFSSLGLFSSIAFYHSIDN